VYEQWKSVLKDSMEESSKVGDSGVVLGKGELTRKGQAARGHWERHSALLRLNDLWDGISIHLDLLDEERPFFLFFFLYIPAGS